MTRAYDIVVLGGGVESLVAAGYLAKAGRSVLLVNEHESMGGALVTSETVPGFRFDSCEHNAGYISPSVVRDLALAHHGLTFDVGEALIVSPRDEGPPLRLTGDSASTAEGLRAVSPTDAGQWEAFSRRVGSLAGLLGDIYSKPPPRPGSARAGDLMTALLLARKARGLGKVDMMEFVRTFPMPVGDLLDDWFEDDSLKGALGAVAVRHLAQGPRSAGTGFTFLHQHVGSTGVPRARPTISGGVGHLPWALEVSARARGVEFAAEKVAQVVVQDGRVGGVLLTNGETVTASAVVSGYDPRRTFLELVDPECLEPEFVTAVTAVRYRGVAAKINLALGELPVFRGLEAADLRGTVMLSPGLDHLERAYNHSKYGEISSEPVLEVVVPSVTDPTLAPDGSHVLSAWVHYAPFHLRNGGWDDTARSALGDLALDVLSRYSPNIRKAIVGKEVLTPRDIESRFGPPEGQLAEGELTLDQILFMRPVPGWSHYEHPRPGLHLCGPSTHPGGGITGQSGALAARRVLRKRG